MDSKAKAEKIVRKLRENGFEALFAGGCVRDLVMGVEPADYDVATNARPEEVLKLFPRTATVGAHFGVILVIDGKDTFEVATFRNDGPYLDSRHPVAVTFSSAKEDALRRDFTINGMFYDPETGEVIDYVGGRSDIPKKIIRAIGDPRKRFAEDSLRLMRAVRFAARFAYALEDGTREAIVELAPTITNVSAERIAYELLRIITGPNRGAGLELASETGILAVILPEVESMRGVEQPPEYHPEGDVFRHTILTLDKLENPTRTAAMAALLHDVGKPMTQTFGNDRIRFAGHAETGVRMADAILRRLKLPNREIEAAKNLIADHMKFISVRDMRESSLKRFVRQDNFDEHMDLHRADCLASHGNLGEYEFVLKKLEEFRADDEAAALRPKLLLNGDDLKRMGYNPGPLFKDILTALEDAQLEGRIATVASAKEFVLGNFPVSGTGNISG